MCERLRVWVSCGREVVGKRASRTIISRTPIYNVRYDGDAYLWADLYKCDPSGRAFVRVRVCVCVYVSTIRVSRIQTHHNFIYTMETCTYALYYNMCVPGSRLREDRKENEILY